MTDERLSDEELADIQRDNSARVGDAYATKSEVHAMAVELRELRALLATPWMNDAQRSPHVYDTRDQRVSFYLHRADHIVTADHALQLGAALIRAALQARSGQ